MGVNRTRLLRDLFSHSRIYTLRYRHYNWGVLLKFGYSHLQVMQFNAIEKIYIIISRLKAITSMPPTIPSRLS